MIMFKKDSPPTLGNSCEKELEWVRRQEDLLRKQAQKTPPQWKSALGQKVPPKVYAGLQTAFAKTFSAIFEKGALVIDKTYARNELMQNHQIQDYAVHLKGSRRELRKMRKTAAASNFVNSAVTMAEGTAFGALGIGMPDIAVFIGLLLRGSCEKAAQYGRDCNTPEERLLILKMIEAALSKEEDWIRADAETDSLLNRKQPPAAQEIRTQIRRTADVFAVDLLVLKFVQGFPVVGIIGGLSNPFYYNKIMKYVQLKYYKRYLMNLQNSD